MALLQRAIILAALMWFTPVASTGTLGHLLYSNRVGRGISLTVIDTGTATQMSLQTEIGEAEVFRLFVLTHSGQEISVANGSHLIHEKAPMAWKVQSNRSDALLQTPKVVYWRYTPGWVLPVRFKLLGQDWQLLGADLPSRTFLVSSGKIR